MRYLLIYSVVLSDYRYIIVLIQIIITYKICLIIARVEVRRLPSSAFTDKFQVRNTHSWFSRFVREGVYAQ